MAVDRTLADVLPRLPLSGNLDLTYRCNNNCRHCWLRAPNRPSEVKRELTFGEIRCIVDEARALGCGEWLISGGEPMLRPDFADIFDYVTRTCRSYSLNTNGTLITPVLAQLLRRRGNKMVALYGPNAAIHDHVTRTPGSFEATMRGFRYLQEAGCGFCVQVIPMRANYDHLDAMKSLARTLSRNIRIGAPWLYLTACGSVRRNAEISRQRLGPKDVVALDLPIPMDGEQLRADADDRHEGRPYAQCIALRREFHIDPYGGMSFCSYVKDPEMRYDLRSGSFRECWETFIPSLANRIRVGEEYRENCGACQLRADCRWCDVYGYIEHRRHGAKVEYLCSVAREARVFKQNWKQNHRRYYGFAGMTLRVESELPIAETTFGPEFEVFRQQQPSQEEIAIRHHFQLPDTEHHDLGRPVYRRAPWTIYRRASSWVYLVMPRDGSDQGPDSVVVFNDDHSRGEFYHPNDHAYRRGNLHSLTLLAGDQVLLARLLLHRQGFIAHSAGAILNGHGLLFVGRSAADRSTVARMLSDRAELLCDGLNIVRRVGGRFRIFGAWVHGEIPSVSAASAPLRAVLFLRRSSQNRLTLMSDSAEAQGRLLGSCVRALGAPGRLEPTLSVVAQVARELPVFELEFDKSGRIVEQLKQLTQ